jgi:hypothetical protein
MTILFIANIDTYSSGGGIFGFWGFIVLAFVFISFKQNIIDIFKKQALLSVSGVFFIFSSVMRFLATEMLLITCVSFLASLIASFVSIVADTYELMSYKLVDGVKQKNLDKAIPDKKAWAMAYGFSYSEKENNINA